MDQVGSALELTKSIYVLEALYYIKTACNKLSSPTIENCFKKAGFQKNNGDSSPTIENCFKKAGFQKNNGDSTSFEWDAEDYLLLSMIVQMERCANEMNVTQENLENYIRIDDIATTEEMHN
ncbi:hypothetical protein QE152_g21686 [Popillia japonica]|uniref:Uncharacterized protein n=1 Tax=Popillia japonica TaxID=7064 RepID=A0AAW1KPL7_POPJA